MFAAIKHKSDGDLSIESLFVVCSVGIVSVAVAERKIVEMSRHPF